MSRWGQEKPAFFVFTEKTGSNAMDNYNKKYISKCEKLEVVTSEWWGYCLFVNFFYT